MPPWVLVVIEAAKRVPWGKVIAAILWLRTFGQKYWDRLTPNERQELLDLVKKSKGRRANLSKKQQDRVSALLKKIGQDPDKA